MTTRRPKRQGPRERPGFRKPKPGGGFPWWIVAAGGGLVVVIILAILLVWALNRPGEAPPITTPLRTTPTVVTPSVSTHTPTPVPTTAVPTRPCTVKEDTFAYRQPDEGSVGQGLTRGRTVNMIEEIEVDGRKWYKIMLPGYSEVLYVRVEAVECE